MAHSTLSPSAAKRWRACPGSIKLSAGIPQKPASKSAAEGTVAHGLGEKMLRGEIVKAQLFDLVGTTVQEDGFDITIDREMVEHVIFYYDTVMDTFRRVEATPLPSKTVLCVEEKVVAKSVSKELFGTADAIIYREGYLMLHVKDLKYGKGEVVEAEGNPQLMIYGLGVLDKLPPAVSASIATVALEIIQPRAQHPNGPVRTWVISVEELRRFGEQLKLDVLATQAENPRFQSGGHCRWCPANPCSEMHKAVQEAARCDFSVIPEDAEKQGKGVPQVTTLTDEQMVTLLRWEDAFSALFKAIRDNLATRLNAGENIPGVKLVTGRSNRVWKDEKKVIEELGGMVSEEALYKPRELQGPASVEKELGAKTVAPYVEKPEGAKKLALDTDWRPAVGTSAQDDFAKETSSLPPAPKAIGTDTDKGVFPF